MSQTNIAITQLAQVALTERVAQEMQGHPEVVRQAAEQATPAALKQQRESVEKTEDSEASRSVKAKKRDARSGGHAGGGKERKKNEPDQEEGESATKAPWAGNIVNLKV